MVIAPAHFGINSSAGEATMQTEVEPVDSLVQHHKSSLCAAIVRSHLEDFPLWTSNAREAIAVIVSTNPKLRSLPFKEC
jgi:hypothetical protein